MEIKTRLWNNVIATIVVSVIFVSTFLILFQIFYEEYRKDKLAAEIIKGTAEMKIVGDEYLLYHEKRAAIQWQLKYDSLTKLMLQQNFTRPENQVIFDRIVRNHLRIKVIFLELVEIYEKGQETGKGDDIGKRELEDRLMSLLLESSQEMVSSAFNLHFNIEKNLMTLQRRIGQFVAFLLVLLLGFIIVNSLLIKRSIMPKIEKLEEGARIVGNGNLDFRVGIGSRDELGRLSTAFDQMTENLKKSTTSIIKLNQEIANHKKTEEELKRKEEELRLTMDSSPIMVFYKDIDGRHLIINKALAEALGRPKEEIEGRKTSEIFSKEIAEQMDKNDRDMIRSGKPEINIIEKYETPEGIRWSNVTKVPLYNERGEVIAIVGFAEDITEQKKLEKEKLKLEAQLLQAQKIEAVGRLAGGIAHDFNNMLTVIQGYSDFIVSRLDTSDLLYQPMQQINEAAKRSADLTRQLLAFSRQQIIAPKRLNLNEQLKGMEKLLKRIIEEDIDLVFMLSPDLWDTYLDPSQVDQVIANLAVNARDAMPDGGILTVETINVTFDDSYCKMHAGFIPGDYVMLAISDTGIGMDTETQEHAFEPFFTTKEAGKGSGLGLSTVYGIVKQNRGFINVYSEPGQGTVFKIYFTGYRGGQEEAATAIDESGTGRGGKETILLVEDEDAVRTFAREILKGLGYRVLEASQPQKAISKCAQYARDIHLLLTDVVMPDMNGKELYGRISALKPGVKVLYMSGYMADAVAHRGVLEKKTAFIQKPFTSDSLGRKVRETLDEA